MKYKIDSKYFDSLNLDTLKILLTETNSLLKETQDSIKSITDKSNDLFKILVVIITALIGYVFTNIASSTILILSIYFIVVFSILVYKLYFIVYPKSNALVGTEPKKIINDATIKSDIEKNEKRFLFVMLQSKQNAIDNNRLLHSKLVSKYKLIITLMLISIVFSLIIFLLSHLYLNPFLDKC
jgi:hypothetical protein